MLALVEDDDLRRRCGRYCGSRETRKSYRSVTRLVSTRLMRRLLYLTRVIVPLSSGECAISGRAGRATTSGPTVVVVMDEAPRQAAAILVIYHIVVGCGGFSRLTGWGYTPEVTI